VRLHLVLARQVDQIADQSGEFTQLGGDVAQDLAARARREHPLTLVGDQQLHVGAQGRERGPQFVAGVGDQLPLPFA